VSPIFGAERRAPASPDLVELIIGMALVKFGTSSISRLLCFSAAIAAKSAIQILIAAAYGTAVLAAAGTVGRSAKRAIALSYAP
jgi:hypothetical protein